MNNVEHLSGLAGPQAPPLQEHLLETADLGPKNTGLRGYFRMTSQDGDQGPRVKYYRGLPSKSAPAASMSISDEPELLEDSLRMAPEEQRQVAAYVRLNKDLLLRLWHGHDTIPDFRKFLRSFRRIG